MLSLGAQQAPAGIISSHQLTAQYTVTYTQLTPRSHTAVWPFSDSVRWKEFLSRRLPTTCYQYHLQCTVSSLSNSVY